MYKKNVSYHIFWFYNFHKDVLHNVIIILCKTWILSHLQCSQTRHDTQRWWKWKLPFLRGSRLQFDGYVQYRQMHIDMKLKPWVLDGKDKRGWICGPHYSHETHQIAGESRVYIVMMSTVFSNSQPGLLKLRPVILTDGVRSRDAMLNFVQELSKLASLCAEWEQQIFVAVNFRF